MSRKLSFKSKGDIKTFSEKQKAEFFTSIPALQEMLKEVTQAERK